MKGHRFSLYPVCASALLLCAVSAAEPRELSFADRVAAQRAIERVYYSHQMAATAPFDEAIPKVVIEKKVRDSLRRSVVLEVFWGTPITADMLRREMDRMIRGTRMPQRLRELYAALGDDPILIQECLARPALADRLSRSFFASDQSIHAPTRQAIEDLRERLANGTIDPHAQRHGRTVLRLRRRADAPAGEADIGPEPRAITPGEPAVLDMTPEDFARWESSLPAATGAPGSVQETPEAYAIHVPLAWRSGEIEIASYVIAKRTWDEWWGDVGPGLDENAIESVATDVEIEAIDSNSGCALDTWDSFPGLASPDPRRSHSAVWTGSLMIVWGGYDSALDRINTGGRYDPAIDTWSPTSLQGAPSPRSGQAAVWTGNLMVVWSGENRVGLDTGGRYDPLTDTWSPTSTLNAPTPRILMPAVWTGSRMLVWGGSSNTGLSNTGGAYDPLSDSWSAISSTNVPQARYGHTAVWTGSSMVVWGGIANDPLDSGGRYDPVNDAWSPTSLLSAPEARRDHTAVWTGTRMIVWGGVTRTAGTDSGALYDPVADRWTPMRGQDPPSPRSGHSAVWTGRAMLVWGGGLLNSGGRYDPASDTWSNMAVTNAPAGRSNHTTVWTGGQMVVWGGSSTSGFGASLGTGGRYDPALDVWTPTFSGDVPYSRAGHTSVWTGSRMVIWGGLFAGGLVDADLRSGGRYDPATDTWEPTALAGAPSARSQHTAVWTGSRMIVWGGSASHNYTNTGGQYDPVGNTWSATSTIGAPSARDNHSVIWTDRLMVIWGGNGVNDLNTGGRYDPMTNTWTSTTTTGAPAPRAGHSAVWTGSLMIVWSGINNSTGGRYDPVADSWSPTSTLNAPSGRRFHGAVWTGTRMLVWGGNLGLTHLNDGARYDPTNDSWSAMSPVDAPARRTRHAALWTGSEMLVWGGEDCTGACVFPGAGGRYDPAGNVWTSMTTSQAPSGRTSLGAAWTGSLMLIWGGGGGFMSGGMGYAYCGCILRTFFQDLDADGLGNGAVTLQACGPPAGFSRISGDCDDVNPAVWGPPGEVGGLLLPDAATLDWMSPALVGGTAVSYDVIRSTDPSDFLVPGVCAATNTLLTDAADPDLPPDAGIYFYLVRAENECPGGQGPLGSASDGTPRAGRACP